MKQFFSGFVLLLVSCAHKPVAPPVALTPNDFFADQDLRAKQVAKVSGKISLHYESENESLSGRGRAISDTNGHLRLELRDPFGRLHYDAALSGQDFTALYPRQKLAYVDSKAGEDYLVEVVGIRLSFADLQDLWVGLLPNGVERGEVKNWEWSPDSAQYEGTLKDKAGQEFLLGVDSETKALKKVQYKLKDQTIVASFSDYEECCESGKSDPKISLARLVNIEVQKGKHQSIEVEWEDIKGIKETQSSQFKITIPEGTKKILMQ